MSDLRDPEYARTSWSGTDRSKGRAWTIDQFDDRFVLDLPSGQLVFGTETCKGLIVRPWFFLQRLRVTAAGTTLSLGGLRGSWPER